MKHLALIIGHSKSSQGAVSIGGESEYRYNKALASQIVAALALAKSSVRVTVMERNGTYSQLPGQVNAKRPDFAIELHFNAHGNAQANGTEMLYWHTSRDGQDLARTIQDRVLLALGLRDRGLVGISSEGQRGGILLRRTAMPCVIAEPFFGSNKDDWEVAVQRKADLATAYAQAIQIYAGEPVTAIPPLAVATAEAPERI